MFIEIKGAQFINKGSELMLHAVLQKVSSVIPKAKFALEPREDSPYEKRVKLGLFQKMWFSKFGIPFGLYFDKFIPQKLRNYYGLIAHEEIGIVFDASGFSYSDQWGASSSIVAAKAYKKSKKIGAKVIMLPQAFGPFTSKKIRKAFRIITENADLVYARDRVSYEHIIELCGEQPNIKIAPDFTNLVEGIVPDYFTSKNEKFCIIPNYRMIDKTKSLESKEYPNFLVNCVKYLQEKDEDVFFLIHEGEKDWMLVKEIIGNLKRGKFVEVIREADPIKIKGIIGACKSVISSRFHGLVSALSQGIPSLGMGWSHKYEELFNDYNFPEGLLSVNCNFDQTRQAFDLITEANSRNEIKKKIFSEARKQKMLVENMWEEISKEVLNR